MLLGPRTRRRLATGAVALAALLAGCGEDVPTADEAAADASDANSRLAAAVDGLAASGDGGSAEAVESAAASFEDALATAREVEDTQAADELVVSLEAARDAAARIEETSTILAEAREAIAGPDRYEPELARTAAQLRGERDAMRETRSSLREAGVEELDEPLRELDSSLGGAAARADRLARPHPVGPLRLDGLGPVDFGLPAAKVRRAFGPPEREEEVGFGLGAPSRIDWIYRVEPDLRVVFDAGSGELSGYSCSEKCALETAEGIGVGDTMASVRKEYGRELRPYVIGVGALALPASKDPNSGGLIFTGNPRGGGKVIAIAAFNSVAGPAGD